MQTLRLLYLREWHWDKSIINNGNIKRPRRFLRGLLINKIYTFYT